MSDADDADLEAQRARLEGQREKWRKEDDERKARLAQWKTQQEERRKERKDLDRRREEALQAADLAGRKICVSQGTVDNLAQKCGSGFA